MLYLEGFSPAGLEHRGIDPVLLERGGGYKKLLNPPYFCSISGYCRVC